MKNHQLTLAPRPAKVHHLTTLAQQRRVELARDIINNMGDEVDLRQLSQELNLSMALLGQVYRKVGGQ